MLAQAENGASAPFFSPIEVQAIPEVPADRLEANIRHNAANKVPFLPTKATNSGGRLAIVAGGPSLNKTIDELRSFEHIMVCGTSHDHVIAKGIVPTYGVICDQAPWKQYLTTPRLGCTYLLATQCDPIIFDHLNDFDCLKWDMDGWVDEKVFEGRARVNGGSTTVMRAPALGSLLGFDDFHFFGVDSSFEDNRERHAYAYEDEREISPGITVRINGKFFRTSLQFLQQARDFQTLVSEFGHLFSVTVHGDGLLRAVWDDMRMKSDKVFKPGEMHE